MLFIHMKDFETRFNGLFYNRYMYTILKYIKNNSNCKLVEISQFKGFQNTNEDIILFDLAMGGTIDEMFLHLKLLNDYKLNKYNCKLYYISGDIWPRLNDCYMTNIEQTAIRAINYTLIHTSLNIEHLCKLWSKTTNLKPYLKNFMYLQYNCYYKDIDINVNNNPINKVLLSGNMLYNLYPERVYLKNLNLPNVEILQFSQVSTYTSQLNSYICSFVSNVSAVNYENNTLIPAKFLLLKYLEVLASGSLLLAEDSIQKEFEDIGLIHGINCYFTSMINIKESIDYIINPDNKNEIDRIRLNGYNYYKTFKDNMEYKTINLLKTLK